VPVHKFLFDVSFDVDEQAAARRQKAKEAAPPPPPPPPTFSTEELEKARTKAYAEGRKAGQAAGCQQGRSEAEGEMQAAATDALVRLADGVGQLVADRDDVNAGRTAQPLRIALAVIGKLLPSLVRRHGAQELEDFITACLSEAVDEPRLAIRINEGLMATLRPRIEEMAAQRGFAGRLIILGDPGVAPADARIEWAEGGAERNTNQLLAEITATAERMLGAQ
jgi:flagellar assembly protein FliH